MRSPPDSESQKELVRCVVDARLGSCTPGFLARQLPLAMKR